MTQAEFETRVEAATDTKIRAIEFDSKILEDMLRLSSWLSAIATTSLALLIANAEKLERGFLYKAIDHWGFICAGTALLVAALFGVSVHWLVNLQLDSKRHKMTDRLMHRDTALATAPDGTLSEVAAKVHDMRFWPEAEREAYIERAKNEDRHKSLSKKCIVLQQIFTGLGLLVAFLAAIKLAVP